MDASIKAIGDSLTLKHVPTGRIAAAKRSYVTRRVELSDATHIDSSATPRAGDVCLARLTRKGHHQRLELTTGRRARMEVGDEIIVAFGNRYATDQFHGEVPNAIGPCQLVAAGGIAAEAFDRHASTRKPTDIETLGTLCRADGSRINLSDYRIKTAASDAGARASFVIAVFGSGMNAGKTTSVCEITRALNRANLSTAAVKLTGTGAGGDMWQYQDCGARHVLDFTDAGHASTMGLELPELERIADSLIGAVDGKVDCIVAEVADGLLQRETRQLLNSPMFRNRIGSIVLATPDPLSALGGKDFLDKLGYQVAAFTGRISASPLFVKELRDETTIPVLTSHDLATRDISPLVLLQQSAPVAPVLEAVVA
ncbi:MAG: hypothetical protein GW850_05390 [Sphingomonadales bacterium]|nr:hypothetical protein [Sphingomonadales bacterium]NCP26021.1 hypothetical protein [Sphingomonadales bacterium]NCP48617.1 hypothetical protein [Sphingomonadales bacterium]